MNRLYIKTIAFAAVSAMLLGSCSREQQNPDDGIRTLTAHIGKQTRVEFDSRTGKFSWSDPDEIALHLSSGAYMNVAVKASGVFNLTVDAGVTQDAYAVYPSNVVDPANYGNPDLKIELPAAYTVEDATGMGDWYPVPMVAVNNPKSDDLWFYHTGGAARLVLDDVPAGTASIVVDFGKRITGSFTVEDPATETPETKTDEAVDGSSVVFNLTTPLAAETDGFILNVPVPTGTYNFIKVHMEDGSGTTLGTPIESHRQRVFARGRGRKISFTGDEDFVLELEGPLEPISQYGGDAGVTVTSYVTSGGVSSWVDIAKTEYSVDGGTTWSEELPGWLRLTGTSTSGDGLSLDCVLNAAINRGVSSKVWSGATTYDQTIVTDLSMQDIYGNPIAQSTANCYVVSAPGWYKFPAVYGNAIKGGAPNEIAYHSQSTEPDALVNFVRHDGNPIEAAWIRDNGILLSDACLVWQDEMGLVSQISFADDYVTFFVDPETIKQGNAVIAVRDAEQKIAWSWHIWVMDSPAQKLATKTVYPDILILSSDGTQAHYSSVVYPLEMMDMNLGWCEKETIQSVSRSIKVRVTQAGSGLTAECDVVQEANEQFESHGNSPFYQWGRKDPMLAARGDGYSELHYTSLFDETIPYDLISSKSQYYEDEAYMWQIAPETVGTTIQGAILTPNVMYNSDQSTHRDSWLLPADDDLIHMADLWNAYAYLGEPGQNNNREKAGKVDVPVVKTVYDPCPVGFSVPGHYAFNGFVERTGSSSYSPLISNAETVETDFGLNFYCDYFGVSGNPKAETTFFPICGVRNEGFCYGIAAFYHSATAHASGDNDPSRPTWVDQALGFILFGASPILPFDISYDTAAAATVRPVREGDAWRFSGNAGSYGHDDWNE